MKDAATIYSGDAGNISQPTAMLDDLDSIPWRQLTHAYGSAEDVPGLLRALRTAPPNQGGEGSPLWCLFGNIWHQGTIYEATAYAVPFLIEIAQDSQTQDRVGVLQLLAAIANGTSYCVVHGDILKESDFGKKKEREIEWADRARAAVASGFAVFVAMLKEEGEIRLAAAHVLAQLPQHSVAVSTFLAEILKKETDSLRRAGLFLLLGQAGYRSDTVVSILNDALAGPDIKQRRAAAFAIARLNPQPLPNAARQAILEAIVDDDLDEIFVGLPWDVSGEDHREDLYVCLDDSAKAEVVQTCIVAIESGNATDQRVGTLLDLLFTPGPVARRPALKASDLSPLQERAVRAMARAMEGGKRIFYGFFPQWGLPETARDWQDLAARTHRG
jgi:hypothetical protein